MRPRPEVRVHEDGAELARAACALVRARARAAVAARGTFHLALAGGSTPRATYAELARSTEPGETRAWRLWFGDERCVPPQDPDSNHRMAHEAWLHTLAPAQIERLCGEAPPAAEAARYAARLEQVLGPRPALDLVLLGLGPDGHTASLFPGTPALAAPGWVARGQAPKPPEERLTLTFPCLALARAVVFLVAGADKREALRRALDPDEARLHPGRTPAAEVTASELLWLVDRAALPA